MLSPWNTLPQKESFERPDYIGYPPGEFKRTFLAKKKIVFKLQRLLSSFIKYHNLNFQKKCTWGLLKSTADITYIVLHCFPKKYMNQF